MKQILIESIHLNLIKSSFKIKSNNEIMITKHQNKSSVKKIKFFQNSKCFLSHSIQNSMFYNDHHLLFFFKDIKKKIVLCYIQIQMVTKTM
jgi:hypothetical protein